MRIFPTFFRFFSETNDIFWSNLEKIYIHSSALFFTMHQIESRILQLFAKNPGRDISTSELVMQVFHDEHQEVQKYIYNEQKDSELVKIGRRKKARLHRKLLYHLNKLEEESFLKVTRVEGKGEKFFSLGQDKVDELKGSKSSRRIKEVRNVIESVSHLDDDFSMLTGIEEYEQEKIIKRFDEKNWINKINSLILRANICSSSAELYTIIHGLYPNYNDVLGIYGFEQIIDSDSLQELTNFVRKLDLDTKDYNKYLNLIIDISLIKNSVKLTDFVSAFTEINPERIYIIFRTNFKTLNNHTRFVKQMIKSYSENKIRVNIQNTDVRFAPYLIGRAGSYTIPDDEWEEYKNNFYDKTIGLCFSETSLYVDIYRFFKSKRRLSELRSFLLKASKALLLATTAQRRKSDLLFEPLNKLNGIHQSKFFAYSFNYIRLWNYDVAMEKNEKGLSDATLIEPKEFVQLLHNIVEEIDEFCKSEETVFKSCGIPIRFRIYLSSAFRRFDKDFLSERAYKKMGIKNISDFSSEAMIADLKLREELLKVFKGGDRVRFFRAGNYGPEEIIDELNHIMSTYNIPLLSYDFKERKGEVTLDNFM